MPAGFPICAFQVLLVPQNLHRLTDCKNLFSFHLFCWLSFTGGLRSLCGRSLTFVFSACFETLSFFTVGVLAFLLRFLSICVFVHFSSSPILCPDISSFSATMALKGSRAIPTFCVSAFLFQHRQTAFLVKEHLLSMTFLSRGCFALRVETFFCDELWPCRARTNHIVLPRTLHPIF